MCLHYAPVETHLHGGLAQYLVGLLPLTIHEDDRLQLRRIQLINGRRILIRCVGASERESHREAAKR